MENTGVTCDVCECRHNVEACKCDLPQIKVTEHCTCSSQQEIPRTTARTTRKSNFTRTKNPRRAFLTKARRGFC